MRAADGCVSLPLELWDTVKTVEMCPDESGKEVCAFQNKMSRSFLQVQYARREEKEKRVQETQNWRGFTGVLVSWN